MAKEKEINDTGKSIAEKLKRAGYNSPEKIANADLNKLTTKVGIDMAIAKTIIDSAKIKVRKEKPKVKEKKPRIIKKIKPVKIKKPKEKLIKKSIAKKIKIKKVRRLKPAIKKIEVKKLVAEETKVKKPKPKKIEVEKKVKKEAKEVKKVEHAIKETPKLRPRKRKTIMEVGAEVAAIIRTTPSLKLRLIEKAMENPETREIIVNAIVKELG